ncbi:MAG: N-acetylmuramoyl-L-alanine amidase [Syntrophomonas sp.]|nr:N-acetylmuramoyl-L-alanine amidase [Syntrophomonas sp.]
MVRNYSYIIFGVAVIVFLVIAATILTNAVSKHEENNPSFTKNISWLNSPIDSINSITYKQKIKEKLVVIDPGHGGDDPGAIYPHNNTNSKLIEVSEKDFNLDISLKLYDLLKNSGIRVEMTRQDDRTLKLQDRGELANRLNASLFVSIHNDSYKISSRNGTTTYFNPSINAASYGITGKRAAQLVQKELVKELGTIDIGVRELTPKMMYSNTKMPIVLAEVAYISNDSDRQNLNTEKFRMKAAQGLYVGILNILNEMIAADGSPPTQP